MEIYLHTTGEIGDYSSTEESAQQYSVGIVNSNNSEAWAVLGSDLTIPADAGFEAACSVSGNWLNYEVALAPYQDFSLSGAGLVVSPLQAGQIIGLDVVDVSNNGLSSPSTGGTFGYTGGVSENLIGGVANKFNAIASIGLHQLEISAANVTIGGAKQAVENSMVQASGIVSAAFPNFFYIESSDRDYGIRVDMTANGLTAGQTVTVTGPVQTLSSGERCIAAVSASSVPGAGSVTPLGLTNKALGGGPLGLQPGIASATGLNNIGLLVKTTGLVGSNGSTNGATWFMVNDGSGVSVKVYGAVPTGTTPYVTVTGASSCEKDSSNNIQRVIQATAVQIL